MITALANLDLVQWATKPAQGELDRAVWDTLVADDHVFLHWQLQTSDVSVLLMNGASGVRWVEQAGLLVAIDRDELRYRATSGAVRTMPLYRGVADGVLFLGWNTPAASAISTDGREKLIGWVSDRLTENSPSRRHYCGLPSPLSDALARCGDFFALFESFAGYVDFFVLPDIVDDSASTGQFFAPFDDFTTSPLPRPLSVYLGYRARGMEFLGARDQRIAALTGARLDASRALLHE